MNTIYSSLDPERLALPTTGVLKDKTYHLQISNQFCHFTYKIFLKYQEQRKPVCSVIVPNDSTQMATLTKPQS